MDKKRNKKKKTGKIGKKQPRTWAEVMDGTP
jgi:hypothetical protein